MLNKPQRKTMYLLASCVHPDMTAKVRDYKIALWHLLSSAGSMEILKYEKDALLTAGGGSVGLRAICLMYQLGYRRFYIHGMDCSFRGDLQHASKHLGKKQHPREVIVGGKKFITASIQVAYARQFLEMVERIGQIADTSGHANFALHGDGMLRAMCEEAKKPLTQDKAA